MPLHPALPIPERLLVFGEAGSGKSTNILDIAKWAQRTKSPAQFHILDSDFAIPRMLTSYPDLTNVHIYPAYDWTDYTEFLQAVKTLTPNDWVCLDFIGSAWQAVQSYYSTQVFKKTLGNYFLEVRKSIDKDAKSLSALQGWTDWQVVNALYKNWVTPLLFRGHYHIYATAKSTQLSSDKQPSETSNTRQLFLRYGVKPTGQKDLPYQFHTVLVSGFHPRTKERTLTTVKDRERSELSGLPVHSFTQDYLVGVAGWKLV